MSTLSVHGVTAGYGRQPVINNISFQLEEGRLLGVIGANGSGKTTLLKALCGILPHEGSCTLDNATLERLSPRQIARLISYIPQRSGVSIDISVLDVVLMGFNPQLSLLEHPSKAMREAALQALQQVGLGDRAEENYLHLSEGQKQLCILARTLVSDSKLLLLDEPESALDFRFRYQMLSLLRGWVASGRRSAVVTLHDPSDLGAELLRSAASAGWQRRTGNPRAPHLLPGRDGAHAQPGVWGHQPAAVPKPPGRKPARDIERR